MILLYKILIWFVSKSEKYIKVLFTEISKSNFIVYCALTFKFVHNENYSYTMKYLNMINEINPLCSIMEDYEN